MDEDVQESGAKKKKVCGGEGRAAYLAKKLLTVCPSGSAAHFIIADGDWQSKYMAVGIWNREDIVALIEDREMKGKKKQIEAEADVVFCSFLVSFFSFFF